jgi:hypothetical protein
LAELSSNPRRQPLPDGIVPEAVIARENRSVTIMASMLVVMMAVIVATGIAGALRPASGSVATST